MRSSLTVLALLESEEEPNRTAYDEIARIIIDNPRQLSCLVQDRTEETLLHLIPHSDRLARLFRCIREIIELQLSRQHASKTLPPRISTRDHIASEIVTLLLELLPKLPGIIEITGLVELLVSALEICVPAQPLSLQKLATLLADYGNILEQLASDESGGKLLHKWVCLSLTVTQDAATLETWTRRLVNLVESCTGKHAIPNEIQNWKALLNVKKSLYSARENMARKSELRAQQMARDVTRLSDKMIALEPDNKKAHIAARQERPAANDITLSKELLMSMNELGLHVPTSRSELEEAIRTLEGEATILILRCIVGTFPCKLCTEALKIVNPRTAFNINTSGDEGLPTVARLEMDVFGEMVGVWDVLLSAQAKKSLQGLHHPGKSFIS